VYIPSKLAEMRLAAIYVGMLLDSCSQAADTSAENVAKWVLDNFVVFGVDEN
jgi:hypothetical protein